MFKDKCFIAQAEVAMDRSPQGSISYLGHFNFNIRGTEISYKRSLCQKSLYSHKPEGFPPNGVEITNTKPFWVCIRWKLLFFLLLCVLYQRNGWEIYTSFVFFYFFSLKNWAVWFRYGHILRGYSEQSQRVTFTLE